MNLSYIAGLIDGEGTITIVRTTRHHRRTCGVASFRPTVMIANTNLTVLKTVRDFLGYGWIYTRPAGKGRSKQACHYLTFGAFAEIERLLVAVRPDLIVKALEADVVLEFVRGNLDSLEQRTKRMGISEKERDRRSWLRSRIRAIPHRRNGSGRPRLFP